jgi:cell division protein FtsN
VAKPRFDFYTILPEMEVVVSAPDVVTEREPPAAAGAPVEEAGGSSYMVQMGSFHKHGDADRMKASLALMGVEADIQKVNVNNGEVFHRVRSTPLSLSEANQLRERLRQQNINSLVVRLRQ